MKPTKEYVIEKFEEYNELCFGGVLTLPEVKMVRTRTTLGHVSFVRKRKLLGGYVYSDFKFCISTILDQPEEEIENTILHEMIHYYILTHQIQDTSAHGKVFRKMMNDINMRFGKHITISHKKTKEEHDQDQRIRQHIICIAQLKDKGQAVMVTARSRIFLLWNDLAYLPQVESFQWFVSTDTFFNRYPRSLTLKLYKITDEEVEEHLKGAVQLVRNGNVIVSKRE